jgi:hypothetical protein
VRTFFVSAGHEERFGEREHNETNARPSLIPSLTPSTPTAPPPTAITTHSNRRRPPAPSKAEEREGGADADAADAA